MPKLKTIRYPVKGHSAGEGHAVIEYCHPTSPSFYLLDVHGERIARVERLTNEEDGVYFQMQEFAPLVAVAVLLNVSSQRFGGHRFTVAV
jgi:hypothetical protein